ncbi:MAG: hypothetical protein GEV10_09715 [Streptosporangiales bacterium]|nr:hypothetical protein [Streptosporangiales bacterium]
MTARLSRTQITVKRGLTPNRRTRRHVENDSYAAFIARAVRAHGRRIAAGDIDGLDQLLTLRCQLDNTLADAVTGLHGFGYSWAEITARTGTTRQAAQQRWGGDPS